MKTRLQLLQLAFARSGDKGNAANIGLIARQPEFYPIIKRHVTAEKVAEHFQGVCYGEVQRYLLDNLRALNFVLNDSLDGGGTVSLRSDAQGKTYAAALLRMYLELSEDEAQVVHRV